MENKTTDTVTNLGVIKGTDEFILIPILAKHDGLHEFITTYNGSYQYVQFEAVKSQYLIINAKLNDNTKYTFKIYNPDTSLFGIYEMTTELGIENLNELFTKAMTEYGNQQWNAALDEAAEKAEVEVMYANGEIETMPFAKTSTGLEVKVNKQSITNLKK